MAEIDFTGFVDDWTKDNPQHPSWAIRVTEPHRKKEGEKWVTVSRTRYTVKAAFGVDIDFSAIPSGSRVHVFGKLVTEVSEKEGKRFENLTVKAEGIEVVDSAVATSLKPAGIPTSWEPVDESLPF